MAKKTPRQDAEDYIELKRGAIARELVKTHPQRQSNPHMAVELTGRTARSMSEDAVMQHKLPGRDIALPSSTSRPVRARSQRRR